MKKFESFIRRTALLGLIGLASYIGSTRNTDVAYATVANGQMLQAVAVTGQAVSSDTEEAVSTDAEKVADVLYPVPVKVGEDTRYGYIDGTGKMVIEPNFIIAGDYSEGVAIVYNGKTYQVINGKGKVIFQTEGGIQDFHNGLAAFSDPKADYKQGYINTKGKVVIKPKYNFAGGFRTDQTAVVSQDEKYYEINNKGKILKSYKLSTKYNVYDITNDGYIIITDPNTYLRGVINLSGKVIVKPNYGEITYLGSGLFGVKKKESDYNNFLLSIRPAALFNKNGKQLTSYKFYDLSEFQGGYASATDSKTTYFISKTGKKVTSLPTAKGRGTMKVMGDVIRAEIDNETFYMKKDGTTIWKKEDTTKLASGITVSTVKMRPNKFVIVNYPKIDGISDSKVENGINKKLKSLFTDNRKNITEKDYLSVNDTFTVTQIKDLLIINKTGYDYPIGAAHGMPISFYYLINVNTGDFYQLKDLFKSNSDYVTKLSEIVAKQMKKANESGDGAYNYDSKNLVSKDQFFYVSEDSLTLYFDIGAIGPYAAGFPKFEIPFKDIKSIINTEGSFWKAFH